MSFARPPPSMKFDSSVSPKFRSRETSNISRCDSQQLVHATCDTNSFKVTSNSGCCWARTQAFSLWQRSGVLDARVYDLYNIFLSCCSCWLKFQGIKEAEKLTLHNATADAFSFLVEDIAERVDSKGPAQIWRSRLRYCRIWAPTIRKWKTTEITYGWNCNTRPDVEGFSIWNNSFLSSFNLYMLTWV